MRTLVSTNQITVVRGFASETVGRSESAPCRADIFESLAQEPPTALMLGFRSRHLTAGLVASVQDKAFEETTHQGGHRTVQFRSPNAG